MAVRKIEYFVSADGIEPSVKQFGGVQGEHRATELVFKIEQKLYESLTAQAVNGAMLIYRIDGYDGEGGLCNSDTSKFEEGQNEVTYLLEEWLTRFGGIVKVVLVISLLKDDLAEMELYSFPALLQLKNLPEGSRTYGKEYKSMSTLAQVSKEAAVVAVEAKEKTEFARAALENGTVWVFDGGDAEGNVDLDGDGIPDTNTADIKFVLDKEMSDSSENAVMNKVVKKYIDNLMAKSLENFKKRAKLDAHPVGSYYWSSEATEPSDLFGGTWERVEGKFILAAGTHTDEKGKTLSFEVGKTGGEYLHTLTLGEMPKHTHTNYYYSDNNPESDRWGYLYKDFNGSVTREETEGSGIGETGGDVAHNNMPPYEVAYCWKRTA